MANKRTRALSKEEFEKVVYTIRTAIKSLPQGFAAFPGSRKEINHTGNRTAVCRQTVAQNEAVKAPGENNAQQPAQSDS